MPVSSRDALIESYLASLPRLRRAVADLGPEQIKARPVAGKWSTLEVVCHLVDSEQAWCHRMKRVIVEDRPLLIGYDETRFTGALGYQDRDLDEELDLLDATRGQMAQILRRLPGSAWLREGVHSERGLITLEAMVQAETDHIPHHIRHILDKRQALGLPNLRGA
jgi:DinB superfamily